MQRDKDKITVSGHYADSQFHITYDEDLFARLTGKSTPGMSAEDKLDVPENEEEHGEIHTGIA